MGFLAKPCPCTGCGKTCTRPVQAKKPSKLGSIAAVVLGLVWAYTLNTKLATALCDGLR